MLGVIGGSGLYDLEGLEAREEIVLETPFGAPSGPFVRGRVSERWVVFLPRHGLGHRLLPHELNFRANIWGFKKLGVRQLISVSAVGSMKEDIVPGELVLVDQFIDRTRQRPSSFYGDGIVVHVPMADPVCPSLRKALGQASGAVNAPVHRQGTYLCIEGPQFSTRAESLLYRTFGVDVIGMTNMPEARLAREAEICYASIALATDYDSWHAHEADVSVEAILKTLRANVERAKTLIVTFAKKPFVEGGCDLCACAARTSLMTPKEAIPPEVLAKLGPILDPFLTPNNAP